MNEQIVSELLQKYFDGATSLEEERELQRYFTGGDIPDSLKSYRPLFVYFAEERANSCQLSVVSCQNNETETRQLKTKNRRLSIIDYRLMTTLSIAASIAILFIVGVPKMKSDNYVYFVNGQRVYNESAALELAENNLQSLALSMQKMNSSMSTFDKLQESSQPLKQFNKVSEALKKIELRIEN